MLHSRVRSLIFLSLLQIVLLLSDADGQSTAAQTQSHDTFPGKTWQRLSSSGQAGWSKEKLAAARAYANSDSIHTSAVMIVQGGKVVDQWGDIDQKISSYSVRKSLLSALYGIYSADGVIDINQTPEQLGIDDSPDPLTKEEKQARVVDLLRARSGVYHVVDFKTDSMKKSRPARGSHPPGTFWYYNNWDFNVLGTIFEKGRGRKSARLSIGASRNRSAWKIFSRTMSITSEAPPLSTPRTTSKFRLVIWPASDYSTCDMAAGTAIRSCPRSGSKRAVTPVNW